MQVGELLREIAFYLPSDVLHECIKKSIQGQVIVFFYKYMGDSSTIQKLEIARVPCVPLKWNWKEEGRACIGLPRYKFF